MPFMAEEAIDKVVSQLNRAESKLEKQEREKKEVIDMAVNAVEIGGAAFLTALANARYGNSDDGTYFQIAGMPVDLFAAVGGHLVGYFDLAGKKYNDHIHSLSNGILAAYGARMGTQIGKQSRAPGGASAKGLLGMGGFAGYGTAGLGAFAVPGVR